MSPAHAIAALQRSVQELEVQRRELQEEYERVWREARAWQLRAEKAEAQLSSITGVSRLALASRTAEAQRDACAKAAATVSAEAATACRVTGLVTT